MELGSRKLSLLLLLGAFVRHTITQEVDPDIVDFSTVNDWDDLKACVQNRLNWIAGDIGCSEKGYDEFTNGCLCRASNLGSAVQIIQEKTMEDCQNIDDKNEAKTILVNYCKSKGYTSIVTPVVQASATGGYTVTATVTQLATSTVVKGGARTSDALGLIHVSKRRYITAMWPLALIFIPFVCA